ncbi:MAG: S9 family peptidase [Candidatus Eisenbacteria bacterium]|uniref:Acyl-peptide hydrolase n=1 Tax=Eiseniibacteriota bacterium TaxID=2212470 RepID=A0A956M079_UNCEI|nr:S9 family peptidase [Candidatus Eisenbacteria bacterium]
MPRVSSPVPSPDGTRFVVPVTTYSMETNQGTNRLWLVPTSAADAGAGGAADKARPLTPEDRSSSAPVWSPDGGRIAFLRKPGGDKGDAGAPATRPGVAKPGPKFPDVPQLYLLDLEGGEAERVTDLPLGVSYVKWFPDGKRIAFLSGVYRDALNLEDTAKRAQQVKEDPVKAHVTEDRFYRYWDTWLTDGRISHLFVLDLETRELVDLIPESTAIFEDLDGSNLYDIAPDGKEIVFGATRSEPPHDPVLFGVFTVPVPARGERVGKRGGKISELTPKNAVDAMDAVYSPDGRWIVFGIQKDFGFYADKHRLVAHDRKTKKQTVLTEAWDGSASNPTFGPDGKSIYFTAEIDARSAFWVLDLQRALADPDGNPPCEVLRGGTLSAPKIAGGRIFYGMSTVVSPPEAWSVDLTGKNRRQHTAFTRPIMDRIQSSEHEEVYFTGAEGHSVHMTLVYPPGYASAGLADSKKQRSGSGKPPKKLPLVHMIHGGPHGVFGDGWHWRWCALAFAARGYACALVNFHGSTSWGQEFCASILGRWGDQPYVDVMAATDFLVDRGVVDPKRMAISGGSYGGYLVSWICSQTDRFRCAVNHAGVCDFQTQYASDFTQGRARAMGGEPWDNIEGMDRYNPMRHARGFRTPMLVVHGELDYRVPYVQGIEIYNVHKAMGIPARLVIYPDENHWILKPRNSAHWYGEVFGWFDRWLKR